MQPEGVPIEHRILALDPGVTTGICHGLLDVPNMKLILTPQEAKLSLVQIESYIQGAGQFQPFHVIYETFEYRNYARAGLDLTPVKLIGVIELVAERWKDLGGMHFYKQSAATGKAFYRDDRLKQLGIYPVGKKHARDAMRHLLQWLAFGAGAQYANIDKLEITLAK